MKRLVGLLFLISFFLPFTAEGGRSLKIEDEYCTGSREYITFNILVQNAPNPVGRFGFEVKYDSSVLEYQYINTGELARGFSLWDEKRGSRVRIYGSGGFFNRGESGKLVLLTFKTKKCEDSPLTLTNPDYDMWRWSIDNGDLNEVKNSGGGGYYPYFPPMPGFIVPGFIPPPGLGYWGFTLPQWQLPIFPPAPVSYDYYSSFQIFPYQSPPYPYW